eukprot:Gb_35829 [translate_table: standard]
MSPAAKSKSKEKSAGRDQKASSKHATTNGGTSASAYNPVSGTFHMLDSVTVYSGGSVHNGRFRNIDDIEDNSGSFGTNTDYDSVSNNGSCSGESEDQKERNGTVRLETPPGLVGGNDRRDKIRHKNEKKHQRQKEKRAQELRDRCTGYLMSRKLEALSQQLVAMGFSPERATMALILNEGRVEESVAWLLEGGEGQVKEDQNTGGNLKIDISEELAHIAGMEIRYKCPRAEVERTVVGCEGDLEKAAELLRNREQDMSPSKIEDNNTTLGTKVARDMPVNSNRQPVIPAQAASRRTNSGQVKNMSTTQASHHSRREDKDFNYAKGRQATQATSSGVAVSEGTLKNIQSLRRVQAKGEWQRPPSPAEKKVPIPVPWPPSTSTPSVSYSLTNTVQGGTSSKTPPAEIRNRTVGLECKTVQVASREPVVVMQRPQSSYTTQLPVTSVGVPPTSPSTIISSGWNGSYIDSSAPFSFQCNNRSTGAEHLKGVTGGKVSAGNPTNGIAEVQGHYQPYLSSPMDLVGAGWNAGKTGFGPSETPLPSSSLLSPLTSSCSVPSSIGLFTGWSSGLTGSSVDWNMGPKVHCDYTNIDWSVAASPSSPSESGSIGFSRSFTSMVKLGENVNTEGSSQHISGASSPSSENSGSYDIWLGSKVRGSSSGIGLQEKTVNESGSATSSFGVHEWTSPFAGKDLFSLPRQLVPSPSL